MKFRFLFTILSLYALATFGQDSLTLRKRTNPIIYLDYGLGAGVAGIPGLQFNTSLNYQFKKNLFTIRLIGLQDFKITAAEITPFTYLPLIESTGSLTETGILYGLRFIKGGGSFSFSAGLSMNDRVIVYPNDQQLETRYVGVPFEMDISLFNKIKRRYTIYGLIPVGKPTAFGRSIAFKFAGNVSQHSYLSFGIAIGYGYFKQY